MGSLEFIVLVGYVECSVRAYNGGGELVFVADVGVERVSRVCAES